MDGSYTEVLYLSTNQPPCLPSSPTPILRSQSMSEATDPPSARPRPASSSPAPSISFDLAVAASLYTLPGPSLLTNYIELNLP